MFTAVKTGLFLVFVLWTRNMFALQFLQPYLTNSNVSAKEKYFIKIHRQCKVNIYFKIFLFFFSMVTSYGCFNAQPET